MKMKMAAGLSLVLFVAACGEKETYPITGCDANEQFPITCEDIGEGSEQSNSNAQDLNALPTGA